LLFHSTASATCLGSVLQLSILYCCFTREFLGVKPEDFLVFQFFIVVSGEGRGSHAKGHGVIQPFNSIVVSGS